MLKPGEQLCLNCGHITTDAFFNSALATDLGVLLTHKKRRNGGYTYEAFRYLYDKDKKTRVKGAAVKLALEPSQNCHGLPDTIRVRFSDDKEYTLSRACPYCTDFQPYAFPAIHRCPACLIPAVGGVFAGKTTLLNAFACDSIDVFNQSSDWPFKLKFATISNGVDSALKTGVTSAGKTNVVYVQDRESQKILLAALLLDVAGEHWLDFRNEDNLLRKIVLPHGTFSGADAVLYLESAATLIHKIDTDEEVEAIRKATELLNQLVDSELFHNSKTPFAYVATKSDLLFGGSKVPCVYDHSRRYRQPLLTPKTFPVGETSYQDRQTVEVRGILENQIVRSFHPTALSCNHLQNSRAFLVQSRTERTTTQGSVFDDTHHHATSNVLDPLLWLITQLLGGH